MRITLDSVVEIDKLLRVTKEEDRRVIAYQIPVALLGVKLHCEASYISLSIGSATLSCYGREAHKEFTLIAYLAKELSLGILRYIVRYGELAPSS